MNLAVLLHRAACSSPLRTACAVGERPHQSYRDLALRASQLGAALRDDLGLASGSRIALVMSNTARYMEVFWGCLHGGLAVVPLHSKLHPAELAFCLARCDARAVFADGGAEGIASDAVRRLEAEGGAGAAGSGCEVIAAPAAGASGASSDVSVYTSLFRTPAAARLAALSPHELGGTASPLQSDDGADELAWLFYTSGTTGR